MYHSLGSCLFKIKSDTPEYVFPLNVLSLLDSRDVDGKDHDVCMSTHPELRARSSLNRVLSSLTTSTQKVCRLPLHLPSSLPAEASGDVSQKCT